MRTVAADEWLDVLAQYRDRGFAYLDYLAGIDRLEEIEVVAHVVAVEGFAHELVGTRVPAGAPRLASVTPVFPAAGWHERETAEMLGIEFVGHPDPRPLLLRAPGSTPPLRKATPLTDRVETPWPGSAGTESAGRRPPARPGVPDAWLTKEAT
jgi:NADH-quinone oxidoreductase subunit C